MITHMKTLRICVVGGIFDKAEDYRRYHAISPETTLAAGLRARGLDVVTEGHSGYRRLSGFDIVHVHHLGPAAVAAATWRRSARFVFTSHNPFLMNGISIGWKRTIAARWVLMRADAVVALSEAEERSLAKRFGVPERRIRIIPNGVDTRVFRPAEAVRHDVQNLLLCVGQMRQFKGTDHILEAIPLIRASHPTVKLMLVYQTDVELPRYRNMVERLGIADAVVFAGPRTAAQLADLYSKVSVLVSPSLAECLSTVVLEAMCCGCAVVATNVGGIREQLPPGKGLIVPAGDTVKLGAAICRFLSDPALRERSGNEAKDYALSTYTISSMIDRHIALYERLAANGAVH